ncbi:hypothetical protein DPMN_157402 [Dreissena polymorpha]|uniref:Uncharacterized protein n=1 Tax=Dreissena polymorpha TaxID=45954 RepID=A0A9D4INS8_DREPO|nr:hypothetical protein DPMN_157402 [Dreissena polymorpha]
MDEESEIEVKESEMEVEDSEMDEEESGMNYCQNTAYVDREAKYINVYEPSDPSEEKYSDDDGKDMDYIPDSEMDEEESGMNYCQNTAYVDR